MPLDSATLYFVATMVSALLGLMLLFFGSQEKNVALKWWGNAYLLGAASVALWTLASGMLGDLLSLALNAVGFVACGMVWNAARVFHGRKPNLPGLVLGALTWVTVVLVLDPREATLRMTIGAAIVSVYAALTAAELWAERRKSLKRRWPAIVVPVLHGFVLLLPILLGALLHPANEPLSASIWVTVFAIERVAHAGRPVTALIFDIDHFKSINDRFGHPAGDELLKLFSTLVVGNLRISDLSGRIGGEEFAALLPCSLEEGVIAAERVRVAFAAAGICVE